MVALLEKMACFFDKGKIAKIQGMDLWYQTFGDKKNPAFLLVMGSGCQGILWPDVFCQKLVSLGLYVIRFDLRDTGFSSSFDYQKNPYNLLDMAQDCILLLDHLKITKAHVMGTSMGGTIAELIGAYFSQRVESLILMATTADLRNVVNAILGEEKNLPLSDPSSDCLDWIQSFVKNHQKLSSLQKIKKIS